MTIEDLLGHSTADLAAMTDEQLMAVFADCFKLEPTGVETPQLISPPKPKIAKPKLSPLEKMKRELEQITLDLNKI